ncbi:DUF4160 domain-containing protein [Oxalobacteraceae bacterium A2-2]
MSPTIFRDGQYRYYFFSREETRMHVHVSNPDGTAKIWIEPSVEAASSSGLSPGQLRRALQFVSEHRKEIADAWNAHFSP